MDNNYKVIYFNLRGIAEPIRFLLSYLNEDFEDHRVEKEEWPGLKPNTPFGKLPILVVDGKQYTQSVPLYLFLGTKAGLAGDNDLENIKIDMIADVLLDLRIAVSEAQYETDEERKQMKKNKVINETLPFTLQRLENIANRNSGYLANNKLSWVDFMFASVAENLNFYFENTDCFSDFPTLKALAEKVMSLPQVEAWIASRPESQF